MTIPTATPPPARVRAARISSTAQARDELARAAEPFREARLAELAAIIRCGGGLHISAEGTPTVEVRVSASATANRVRTSLRSLFSVNAELRAVTSHGPLSGREHGTAVAVTGSEDAETVARNTGLLDRRGRPVVGLPSFVIGGKVSDAQAAWRGAFLVSGQLERIGRNSSISVRCPNIETAMGLVACARRMGAIAVPRPEQGSVRVVVRDMVQIGVILRGMGATDTANIWEGDRLRREVNLAGKRLTQFTDANLRRSKQSSLLACQRVEHVLTTLGDRVPEHLAQAGRLRLAHPNASLDELGRLSDPPMTKDAVAGRIRRLLALSDSEEEGAR